ncbi:MAG: response regulator [Deltaproteobacteria bacterium]|nr:response regulator [Nannocystaceae bacterium]
MTARGTLWPSKPSLGVHYTYDVGMLANEILQAKLHDAPIGFAVIEGPAMIFTVANARYREMVARADIVGRGWVDVFPELVGTPTHDAVRSAYAGQRVEVAEFAVPLMRDGQLREGFYSFSLDPTRSSEDGEVDGLVVLAVDVTELVARRKEAELLAARLRDSEARYRALFDAMDDGFCLLQMIFDDYGEPVDYRFLEANDAFLHHTGLPAPVGKTASELVPDLDASWFQLYGRVATTGVPARFENHAPAMDRWFDVFASRVGDPELRLVGVVFKNVNERKRAELAREAAFAAEQAARREAEQASRLKDEFLATVSHELRTPLHAMLGWLSLLRGDRVPDEKRDQALETIERNARSQARLIEDLLDVSRILAGKLRLDVEPTELRHAIEAAIETVRPAAEAKGVRLQAALSSGAIVMGDAQRLQQVVWNLVSNAVKFTPGGGRVQIVLQRLDSAVEITVVDSGIGIPAAFLPHVFERFRQADGGTTRVQGGMGLGLSIVRHLVEMHGGNVSAESEGEGQGSRFTLRLPLAVVNRIEPAPAQIRHPFECPPELMGLTILVVDDEEDAREVLRTMLEGCGAIVRVAGSVSAALRCFEDDPPRVLLTDIGMPGDDGYALIRSIRALPPEAGGDTPAVALTAYARSEDRTRCMLAGFSNHVPKPVEPRELLAVVASLAGRTRSTLRDS